MSDARLDEKCSMCRVPRSSGPCYHVLDLGDGRVVMKRSEWESLLERLLVAERERDAARDVLVALVSSARTMAEFDAVRDAARAVLAECAGIRCPACNGEGRKAIQVAHRHGVYHYHDCHKCGGTGQCAGTPNGGQDNDE